MSTNIRFKRSDIPGKVPSLDSIDLGELALNTADGKLFTKQEIKGPPGVAAIQKIIEIGATEVPNVLYVAKNGDDSNSGKTLGQAFLTLKKALSIATPGTTIFLKSGEYIEDNPLRVPARVSVVGDNLRNTTVRPKNPTKDIFWVYNGAYIFCMNFKGHIAPSAAVCFPPDGSAGEIVTSPYTQAVTSITTTGTGMRVDGAVTTGLRSMVCDAFTQYNQGGIGIHMLNRGNTQLVSIFTICCDISFMCENGGFCSVNLSNSSFGNYGLVSRGASEPLYRGVVKKSAGRQITFKNLARRPNIGDGVLFADYNQRTCDRDNGLVVDGLAFDLLYEGTTQSTFAGLRYWKKDEITTGIQQQAQTAAAIKRAQVAAATVLASASTTAKRIVSEEFEIISKIVAEGPLSPTLIVGPDLDAAEPEYKKLREQVLDRKAQIEDAAIDFLKKNYPLLAFVSSKCKRDIGFIIEAVADDMIFGSNYKTIKAAVTYLTATENTYTVTEEQRVPTIEAYRFVRDQIVPLVQEDAVLLGRVQSNFEIITTALKTVADGGGTTYINDLIDYQNNVKYKLAFPAQQDTEESVVNLVKNLQANKKFVAAEVVDYLRKNWPNIVIYGFGDSKQETCKRDIGYTIDALCYDLMYGGNSQTVDAAKRYYNYASGLSQLLAAEEIPATIDAFGRAQLFAQRVVILDTIEAAQEPVPQVKTGLVATTQTQVNRLGALFSLFLKGLENEIVGTSDFIQPNGKRLNDTDLESAFDLLQANKDSIKENVIAYLGRAFPGFDYDRVKCARDVGYIIDSICFDLVHGGNRQAVTAGIYYFDFNEESNVLKTVVPNQIKQTVNAYKYMKELIRDVITCSPTPNPWQPAVPQRTDFPAATSAEVVAIGNLIDIINEILVEGPFNSEDSIQRLKQPIGLVASSDVNKQRAFDLLMANRDFIRAEMIAYINQNWYTISDGDTKFARVNTATDLTLGTTTTGYPTVTYQPTTYKAIRDAVLAAKEDIKTETIKFMANSFFDNFSFNKPKCYRDVGLILDAILSDMVFGSNYKTINAAISYLRAYASEVVGNQKVQTVASLKAAKEITLRRIVSPNAKVEISTRFDIIIAILDGARTNELGQIVTSATINNVAYSPTNGYGTALTFPIPTRNSEEDLDRKTAVTILRNNVEFIKKEVVAYIDANFTLNEFDKEKCARDVELIVEALAYDLAFTSNFRSISAGRAYYRANAAKVAGDQKLATIGSFKHLRKLAKEVVKVSALAVNSVESNMDIIIDIVDKGLETIPKYRIPFPEKGRLVEYKRARDLVEKNREFIVDDVLTYINTPGLELLKGQVRFQGVTQNFSTDGRFTVTPAATATSFTILAVGDLVRISGKMFSGASISGYNSPSVYKVASVEQSNPGTANEYTSQFKLVNLDGSPLITTSSSGLTNTMRFEKIVPAEYALPAGFDVEKCRRDLNLILDALFYDTTYGGTLESKVAGLSYAVGTLSQLDPSGTQMDEVSATLRAYQYLKLVVQNVAQDLVWTPTVGNITTQIRSPNGSDGSAAAAIELGTCVDLIIKLIDDSVNESPAVADLTTVASVPSLDWIDPALKKSFDTLMAGKESLKTQVTDFVDDNYVLFGYDRDKCARDVELVIDAVRYDMMFNSNFRSIVAGRSYYRAMASTVVKDQKSATLASFQHLKTKLLEIVKAVDPDNPTTAESAAIQRVSRSMDIILNILENGLAVEPAYSLPLPTAGTNNSFVADIKLARDIVETNREFIEDALITWIEDNKGGVNYSQTACRRDVEYILDAIYYDLTYGGNLETRVAALAYYAAANDGIPLALGAGEKTLTVTAYAQLKVILEGIAEGDAALLNTSNTQVYPLNKIVVGKTYRIVSKGTTSDADWTALGADANPAVGEIFVATAAGAGATAAAGTVAFAKITANPASDNGDGVTKLIGLVDVVKNYIDTATLAAEVAPTITWVDANITKFNTLLNKGTATGLSNVNKLKTAVTDFVDLNFAYNKDKCARDVGFLIDAMCYDVLYGGNVDTTQAAISYFDGAVTPKSTIPKQIIQTVAAYERMKEVIAQVVQLNDVQPSGNKFTAKARVNASFDLLNKIILDGPGFTPSKPFAMPKPTATGAHAGATDYFNAVKMISSNRQFLIADTLAYIDKNSPPTNYNRTKCERDIDLILDAVMYDINYGGNTATFIAAESYYANGSGPVGTLGAGELSATQKAFAYLGNLLKFVASGTKITSVTLSGMVAKSLTTNGTFELTAPSVPLLEGDLITASYTGANYTGTAGITGFIVGGINPTSPIAKQFRVKTVVSSTEIVLENLDGSAIVTAPGASGTTTGLTWTRNQQQIRDVQRVGVGDVTGTASTKAQTLVGDLIVDIITDGATLTAKVAPTTTWVDEDLVAFSTSIDKDSDLGTTTDGESFVADLKTAVAALMADRFPGITYPGSVQTQCEQDIDAVLEAVRFDVMFGTNYRTQLAANAYYRAVTGAANVLANQKDASIAVFEEVRDAVLEKVTNFIVEQNKSGSAGSAAAAQFAYERIINVKNYVDDSQSDPTETLANTSWVDPDLVASSTLMNNAEDTIKLAITTYINDRFPTLDYSVADCQEDIVSIIDAVRFDMMFDSNFRTITAARAYFRAQASKVVGEQKTATVEAFKLLKEKLVDTVKNVALAAERVADRMDLLIDIVTRGEKAIPAYVCPSPTGYNTTLTATEYNSTGYTTGSSATFGYARNLIESNREFIKAEVLKYLLSDAQFATLDFVESKCLRDMDLVLDALYYDMTYGGNMESVIAGGAYYRGNRASDITSPQEEALTDTAEVTATIAAFTRLADLVKVIAKGDDVNDLRIIVKQSPGDAGSSAAAQTAQSLAWVIRNLCNQDGSFAVAAPAFVEPSYSWVQNDLKFPNDLLVLYKTSDAAQVIGTTSYPGRSSLQSQMTEFLRQQIQMARVDNIGAPASLTLGTGPLAQVPVTRVGDWTDWFAASSTSELVNGQTYVIHTLGNVTNWTAIGADASPAAGEEFTYNGTAVATTNGDPSTGKVVKVLLASQTVAGKRYKIKTAGTTAWSTINATTAYSASQANDTFIRNSTVLNAVAGEGTVYEMFTYDIEKCERDVGLVIDAVRYDMMFDSQFRTITAARSYWRQQSNLALASGATSLSNYPQTKPTEEMFKFLKTRMRTLPETYPTAAQYAASTDAIPAIVANSVSYNRISSLMDYIILATTAANEAALIAGLPLDDNGRPISIPLPGGGLNNSRDEGYRKARDLIQENREFIKAELIAWIDQQKRDNREGFATPFVFNRTKCKEDIDFILDAVYYDLTYGGNMESYTAGLAYYSGVSVNDSVGSDEKEATIRAYNQLGYILADVARNVTVKSVQNELSQVRGTAGSVETARKLSDLIDIVINVVKGGTKQVPPRVDPDFLAGDETLAYVRIAVQEQKFELQARIADYIDAFILQYNTEKCARDVGLILDAAMYDLVLNSNFQSITAGSVYLQKAAQVVTSTQIGPQLQAIKFIRDQVIAISQKPPLVKNEAAIGRITNLFDLMFDIIDKGVEVAPPISNVAPLGAAFNPNAVNAAASLIANKEFLKEEVVAYVTANYKTYDQSRCSRDVELIINAALYDLLLGTNYNSVKAGLAYRRAASSLVITDQLKETLGGIDFAKDKLVELIDDAAAIASVTQSFELISSIISGGSDIKTASMPIPGGSVYALPRPVGIRTRNPKYARAAAKLRTEKASLQAAVTAWINTQINDAAAGQPTTPANSIWTTFTYDATRQANCEKDVGYLIDAIAFDLIYGGNMETLNAGYAYYEGTGDGIADSLVNDAEVGPTMAAYEYLAEQIRTIVNAEVSSVEVSNEARDLVLLVRNLIDARNNAVPGVTLPGQVWVDPLLQEISSTLNNNKASYQDNIIDYVNNINTFAGIAKPDGYDVEKCRRDVGLVLDAIRYDMMFGTSYRTISAARSYRRSFTTPNLTAIGQSQAAANLKAFQELKERILGKKLTSVVVVSDALANVAIDNTTGQITFDNPGVDINEFDYITVSGTITTGTGGIDDSTTAGIQFTGPQTFRIKRDNNGVTTAVKGGSATTLTLEKLDGTAVVSVIGSTDGLTFTRTSGKFTCADSTTTRNNLLRKDLPVRVAGVYQTGTATLQDFSNIATQPKTYYIIGTPTNTSFQLSDSIDGDPIRVSPGTTAGLTFEVRPSLDVLDEVITQGLLDTRTLDAKVVADALQPGVEYKIVTDGADTTTAGSFIIGGKYRVAVPGITDFNGAAGTTGITYATDSEFVATDLGSGTGTAKYITDYTKLGALSNNVNQVFVATGTPSTTTGGSGQVKTISIREKAERLFDILLAILQGDDGNATLTALGFNFESTLDIPAKNGFVKTQLNGTLNAVSNTITVDSNANFLATGQLIIGDETINYTGKGGAGGLTTFTGCTRAVGAATTTTTATATNSETSITVADTTGFPNKGYLVITNGNGTEEIRYSGKTATTFVGLTRASGGTTAVAIGNGDTVRLGFSHATATEVRNSTASFYVYPTPILEAVDFDVVADYNTAVAAQTARVKARDNINQARLVLERDLIQWIDDQVSNKNGNFDTSFAAYWDATNKEKCRQDIKFILDAITYDLTYGGNQETIVAGKAYYDGSVLGSERLGTADAYAWFKTLINAKAEVGGGDATSAVQLVDYIISYIDPKIEDPIRIEPDTSWVDSELYVFSDKLKSEAPAVAKATTDYINANFPVLAGNYNVAKCQRDVQLIIDAVRFDMMFDSNLRTIVAARSYYRSQVVNGAFTTGVNGSGSQKSATIAAFAVVKVALDEIVKSDDLAKDRVAALMDIVLGILVQADITAALSYITTANTGTTSVTIAGLTAPLVVPNGVGGIKTPYGATPNAVDIGYLNATNVVKANFEYLVEEVYRYVEANTPPAGYNVAKCKRDTALILDAVLYDLTYGGSLETVTAAIAYYEANSPDASVADSLPDAQLTKTKEAFDRLATVIEQVILNTDVAESSGHSIAQITSLDAGSADAAAQAKALVQIVRDYLDSAIATKPTATRPSTSWVDNNLALFASTMLDRKESLGLQVTDYIDATFQGFSYDKTKCQRDVGYVVDAVRYDMMFGNVFRSWTAGRAYLRSQVVSGNFTTLAQKEATLASFRFLKTLLLAITGNNQTAANRVRAAMNVVIDVLEYGVTVSGTMDYGTDTYARNAYNPAWQAAVDIIAAKKDAIKASMGTWLDGQTTTFTGYDKTDCLRDVGYLIDAIRFDLTYGGNMESWVAGQAYYSGTVLGPTGSPIEGTADHISLTKAAFTQLGIYIKAELSSAGNGGAVKTAIDALINTVNQLIDNAADTSVKEVVADASWTEVPLQEISVAMRLQANTIKTDVGNYVDTNFPGLMTSSQKEKCIRDAGLLIDAVRWDMLLNSNFRSATAGRSYWRDAVNLNADALATQQQKAATIAAFTYLKDILQGISATNSIAYERVTANMDIILEIIQNGPEENQANPAINWPSATTTNGEKAAKALIANKTFLMKEVSAYINATYNQYQYDEARCFRDVGLIVDAVAYDMVTGGNFMTVRAAQGYLRKNATEVYDAEQKHITLLSLKYLKQLLGNYVGTSTSAGTAVKNNIEQVIKIVYGASVSGGEVVPAATGEYALPALNYGTAATTYWTATNLTVGANVTAVKAAIVAYIAANNPPSSYSQPKCERDIGYILEGLRYDLTHGGNWATVINARSYWVGTTSQLGQDSDERLATWNAFKQLKTVLNASGGTYNGVAVAAGLHSGTVNNVTSDTRVDALLDIIVNVVDPAKTGLGELPAIVYPELLGHSNELEAARNILISNRKNAQEKVVRWVNNRAYFTYDVLKCERDIGYILEAVYGDVATGSNFLSKTAGEAYLRNLASNVNAKTPSQKWAHIAALEHAKVVLADLVSTNTDAGARIRSRLQVVIDILNEESNAEVTVDYASSNSTRSATDKTDIAKLDTNKTAIANMIEEYLDDAHDALYNLLTAGDGSLMTKCKRDVGLILDAVRHDLYHGGNAAVRTAAISYLVGNALQLGTTAENEKAAMLGVIDALKLVLRSGTGTGILSSISGANTLAAQFTTTALADDADAKLNVIREVINDESLANLDALDLPDGYGTYAPAAATLAAARELNQWKVFENMNSRPYLDYTGETVTKCERDVEIIVDAVASDIANDTNYRSVTAGLAYLRSYSKVVTAEQKAATIASLYLVKRIFTSALTATAKERARLRMNDIIDIINRGAGAAPALSIASSAATDVIVDNYAFIKAEVRAYIDRNYNELDYNKAKCERDVGLILDALRYDVAYGGNTATTEAGLAYWEGNSLTLGTHPTNIDDPGFDGVTTGSEDELSATVAAYGHLKTVVQALLNDDDYVELQDIVSRVAGTGDNTKSADAGAAIDKIIAIIDNGDTNNPASLARAITAAGTPTPPTVGGNTTLLGLKTDANWPIAGNSRTIQAVVSDEIVKAFMKVTTLVNNAGNIANNATTIEVDSVADFPSSGKIKIDNELIAYTGVDRDLNTFTGCTRGFDGTTAAVHNDNAVVTQVVQFFVYRQAKCEEDVGFIVEGLAFDALYGGNKESREVALQYAYKGGLVIPLATKAPTIGGYNRLIDILDEIISNVGTLTPSTGNNISRNTDTVTTDATTIADVKTKAGYVIKALKGETLPALVEPDSIANKTADPEYLLIRAVARDAAPRIAAETITFINDTYAGFGYLQDTCKRDVGLTIDAVAYDLIYGGNSRTKFAAEQYFSGGRFQIPADSKSATVACFVYLGVLSAKVARNEPIVTFQNYVDQDKSNTAATSSEVTNIASLFDAFTDILTNGYISVLQLDATFNGSVDDNTFATFHQVSTITTTGHTLEWVGTGIDVDSALPYNGGVPKPENQLVSDKGGFINFTSTDEKGDFRIGPDLTIKRDSGSIIGRAFNKSLLGVVTPYILALQS
jgi:hypothetical protein